MNEADALDLMRAAMATIGGMSWPALLAAMVIGAAIALFQALTQIQESTLTFVPKMVGILLALTLSAHYAGALLFTFTQQTYARIATGY